MNISALLSMSSSEDGSQLPALYNAHLEEAVESCSFSSAQAAAKPGLSLKLNRREEELTIVFLKLIQ
ncbi:hypothetical protein DY000_02017654 [Brassica cretica]|uniref:Uncharacterized protein n=1 Tax=Brassica cretica TaxID=69181 RepID=A0ABQ7CM64_BRACR|nr:hypothetical protein DY000_02017654 [Brassica cretica]